jgi:hypothetical protein
VAKARMRLMNFLIGRPSQDLRAAKFQVGSLG